MGIKGIWYISKFAKSHHVLAPYGIDQEVREDWFHNMLFILNKTFLPLKGDVNYASECKKDDEELQQNIFQVKDCSESQLLDESCLSE